MLRNAEIKIEGLVLLIMTAVLTGTGLVFGGAYGLGVLAGCLCLTAAHCFFDWRHFRQLQKLSMDLDSLLHSGTPLSIRDYEEGELSILSSQIQKLTLRLTESAEALRREKRGLSDALADISHQLRTPLTAMNLTAAMLSAPELTADRRLALTRELRNLLARTDWLVETLLKLSKLDAGTVALSKERIAVSQLVERAAEPLAIPMELRGQRFFVDCGEAACRCDLVWTAEAVGNLLKNAVEHTPEGGAITVKARETALYTQITVEDTGPGFAEQEIPHLFERFYKGSGAAENSYGIGLALARTVITAQNGAIQAENTPSGARFTVKFYKQVI